MRMQLVHSDALECFNGAGYGAPIGVPSEELCTVEASAQGLGVVAYLLE